MARKYKEGPRDEQETRGHLMLGPGRVWQGMAIALVLGASACLQVSEVHDAAGGDAGLPTGDASVPVAQYCERAVDVFCPFYMRCGRIAESTQEACRSTFLETCEQLYEPRYRALAEAGWLELSAPGLDACSAYLAQVPCEHHLLDLEGGCRNIWMGTRGQGEACGVSFDSFVCGVGTSCTVSLSLCGTCDPVADTGGSCAGDVRCRYPDLCVDDMCLGPALPGEVCGNPQRCIAGATCQGGICVARQFVDPGSTCDAEHRCKYRSTCLGGTCYRDALLGEVCGSSTHCASGACDAVSGLCVALREPGDLCSVDGDCLSGDCPGGFCAELLSTCLQP
ncbi:MAG: hypothetical protein ABIJ09_04415 [Pseudomonadota bacterium]